MFRKTCVAAGLAVTLCAEASAALVNFSGTMLNTNAPPTMQGRCDPGRLLIEISPLLGTAAGTSTVGDFSFTQSQCASVPPMTTTDGLFELLFEDGSTLLGTLEGTVSAPDMMGARAVMNNFVITGGSGRFLGASGAFTGMGTLSFAAGLARVEQTFTGVIDAPEIPLPAAAMLFPAGIAAFALARRRRARCLS